MKEEETAVGEITVQCKVFNCIASVKKLTFESIYIGDG